MPNTEFQGGCSCGKTRYRMTSPALIVHACHCRMCQRLSGGTNAVNILIEAIRVELLSGDTIQNHVSTPSGHGQIVTRCASCHVALWSEYRRFSTLNRVNVLFVRAGTLDQPEHFPPDVHIYAEHKMPHVEAGASRPEYTRFYDLAKVWSPDSQERLADEQRRLKEDVEA